MRTSRIITLLMAIVCIGIGCKKNESSLNTNNEVQVTVGSDERAAFVREFERATGLRVVNKTPANLADRLSFETVQEAARYFNGIKSSNRARWQQLEEGYRQDPFNPELYPPLPANLPVPEEDQGCVNCKIVTVVCTMPFHAAVLIGRLYFKKDPYSPQYNFVYDSWHLSGIHLGLNASTPISITMHGYTKFSFTKLIEYFVGIRFGDIDITASMWYRIQGSGDCNNSYAFANALPLGH